MASQLFNLVAQAKAKTRGNVHARAAARRLEQYANEYSQGKRSKWSLTQEINRFEKVVGEQILHDYTRKGGMYRHGVGQKAAAMLHDMTKGLGQFGTVLQNLFSNKPEGYQENQVAAAVDLLHEYQSDQVTNHDKAYTRQVEAAMNSLEDHGWSVEDTMATLTQSVDTGVFGPVTDHYDPVDEASQVGDQSIHQTGRRAAIDQQNTPRLSKLHPTPQSSNVFSFQYDYATSTLYVRFKAPGINSNAVQNYTSAGGMRVMAGDMGKTITGKTDAPGPLYAYYDVPIKIFKRMIAGGSAGKAVWDMLRVRGSIWGHQYRYGLVEGAMVPGEDGKQAMYVPRRVVAGGYRSRHAVSAGHGRRKHGGSTLPQDMRGHATIRAMRHRPDRGIPTPPNRGRTPPPNRGR